MSQTTLNQLEFLAYQELTKAIDELADFEEQSARAEADHKRRHAEVFLTTPGSMAVREIQANNTAADALEVRRIAEGRVRVQRERIRALHARIDVGRTLASSERTVVTVAP